MPGGSGFGSGSGDRSTLTEGGGGSGAVGVKYGGAPAGSALFSTRTSPGPRETRWVGTNSRMWLNDQRVIGKRR